MLVMSWKERIEEASQRRAGREAEEARLQTRVQSQHAAEKQTQIQLEKQEKIVKKQQAKTQAQIQRQKTEGARRARLLLYPELEKRRRETNNQFSLAKQTLVGLEVRQMLEEIRINAWIGQGSVLFKPGVFRGWIANPQDEPKIETRAEWPGWKLQFRYYVRTKEGYTTKSTYLVPEYETIPTGGSHLDHYHQSGQTYSAGPYFGSVRVPTGRMVEKVSKQYVPPQFEAHQTGLFVQARISKDSTAPQQIIVSGGDPDFWGSQTYNYPGDPRFIPKSGEYIINLKPSEAPEVVNARERLQSILADYCVYQIENRRLPADILKQPNVARHPFLEVVLGWLDSWAE